MDKGWDFGLLPGDLNEALETLRQISCASSGLLIKLAEEENAAARARKGSDEEVQEWDAQLKIVQHGIATLSAAVNAAIAQMSNLDEALDGLIRRCPPSKI